MTLVDDIRRCREAGTPDDLWRKGVRGGFDRARYEHVPELEVFYLTHHDAPARIAELEARIKGFLEAEADSAGGAPDKSEARHKAFIALRCSIDWPTKASCDAARATLTPEEAKE